MPSRNYLSDFPGSKIENQKYKKHKVIQWCNFQISTYIIKQFTDKYVPLGSAFIPSKMYPWLKANNAYFYLDEALELIHSTCRG